MLINPELNEVINGDRGMLRGIDSCIREKCLVSAVILMFSTLDAIAALTRPVDQQSTDGKIFKNWVDLYINPTFLLKCTADDLWSARCGVLHLYSPESDLAIENKARRLYYQWREGPEVNTSRKLLPNSVVVIVEDLHNVIKKAIQDFMEASETDDNIKKSIGVHLPTLLCYVPFSMHADDA